MKRRLFLRRTLVPAISLPLLVLGILVGPVERTYAAFPYYERDRVIGTQNTVKVGSSGPAVDSDGNIYVGNDGVLIKKFDSNFNYITSWNTPIGAPSSISGIFVDADDNIWATDIDNNSVYKFTNTGTLLMHIGNVNGTGGTGNGQFNSPRDVIVDASGDFYVADGSNHRIQKFNSAGVFQWTTAGTTASSADGRFSTPTRLAFASNGNVYVADTGNNRIQYISPTTGAYVGKFGYTGGGLYCQQLDAVKGLAIDTATDTIYVNINNTLCDNIYRFNSTGTYIDRFSNTGSMEHMELHGGSLYGAGASVNYANTSYTPIKKLNASTGAVQSTFGTGINNGDLRGTIIAVAEDSTGNLYVADANQRVTKYNSSGVFVSIIADYGLTNPDDLRLVADIAVDSSDNLYVLDATRRTILKFDSTGAYVTSFGSSGTGDGQFNVAPTAITVTDDGIVFASGAAFFNRYTTSGTFLSKVTTSNATTLTGVGEMLTDSQGNVRVLWNSSLNRITTYTSAGAYVSLVTINDPGDISTSADNFTGSDEFAIDSYDNIYAYNYRQDKVAIIKDDGKIRTSWSMKDLMPTYPAKKPSVSTTFAGAFYISPNTNAMYISHRYIDWLEVIEQTATVTPPTAPQNVSATGNGNSLDVTWQAPANNNNGPIRGYTIEYRPEDFGSWILAGNVSGGTLSFNIKDLLADNFDVRVTATNDAGDSVTASASASVTGRATYVSRQPLGPDGTYVTGAGVDPTNGEIYIYDDGIDGFIQVYNSSFVKVRQIGSFGGGAGQVSGVRDIEFGPDNLVYVADYSNNRVSVFEKDGTPVTQWGVSGTGAGQLTDPNDLSFDTDGTLIVTNEYGRIQRFTTTGTYIEQLAPEVTEGVSTLVDEDGNLYAMNATYDSNAKIYKYDPSGTLITTIGNGNGELEGEFYEVYDMDITPAGELVFNDTWNGRIHFYSLDGQYLETIGYPVWGTLVETYQYMALSEAYEIEVLPDGTMYVFQRHYDDQALITLNIDGGTTPPPVTTPSAPQNASRTVNGQNVDVSWSAPSSNGGGAITGYQVRHKLNSDSTWTTVNVGSTTYSTTLSNLTPGTHDITVAAQNSAGLGSVASLSATVAAPDPTPITPPSAPQAVSHSVSGRNLNVNWQPPANNGGGPITGYKVRYRKNPLPTWSAVSLAGSATSTTIPNLENGTYDVTVSAENSLGEGTVAAITAVINEPESTPTPAPTATTPSTPTSSVTAPTSPTSESTEVPDEEAQSPANQSSSVIITPPADESSSPTLTWEAPEGFPVKEYIIEYRPIDLPEWIKIATVSNDTFRYTIDLEGGSYIVRVSAVSTDINTNTLILGTARVDITPNTATETADQNTSSTSWLAPALICIGLVAGAFFFLIPIWWKKKRKKQPSFLG